MGIPTPEPGLVLNYAYLWHDEYRAGREEGRKNRPSVIVLCLTRESDDVTVVTVLPITHSRPIDPNSAVEIPLPVKRHLGLDDERSWIVIAEGNEFVWPGYDLRKVPTTGRYEFGFLPPRFFDRVRDAFVAFHKAGRPTTTPRT
jgi:hypothetical protein